MHCMIIPMWLTTDQQHILIKLYEKCNFRDMTVKYTVEQLVADSDKRLNLTTKKIRTILKYLSDNGHIEVIKRGTKGNATIYRIKGD